MLRTRRFVFSGIAVVAVVSLAVGALFLRSTPASHAAAVGGQTQHLTKIGTGGFTNGSTGLSGDTKNQAVPQNDTNSPKSNAKTSGGPTTNPKPAPTGIAPSNPGFSGFQGLDHHDTRTRDGGNAFSLEPPDQGLCVGNGKVLETVNDVLVVFDKSGNRLTTATSMNTFFGLAVAVDRTKNPRVPGPFLSDPKCYYDASSNRFFLTMLEEDNGQNIGATGRNFTLIAVSQTGDPTGAWTDFRFDVTDDGQAGTPSHANCPCFGDQPLLGADANGFYVTTNEFNDAGTAFNGAQVYAISKSGLVAAANATTPTLPTVVDINAGAIPTPDAGGIWYSIQPATAPNSAFATGNGGTEYFLSALQFGPAPLDNRIAAWALTNTSSLSSATPNVTLLHTVIGSETYGVPATGNFAAGQLSGRTPLADSLGAPENSINANDDRMNQVVYANGLLWSGVNTVVGKRNNVGIAYFIVAPSVSADGTSVSASVANQGYVSLGGNGNVLFPSIGVNSNGQGVMTFSLSNSGYFPTSAYVTVDATNGAGLIHIAGAGVGPADGFTGYAAFGGNGVERWGDYSAAVADSDGSIWFASEYIAQSCTDAQYAADTTCGGTRTSLANWSTFIGNVSVAGLN